MILNNNNTHNSIAYDVRSDDLTYRGYMALAYAICGIKDSNGNWNKLNIGQVRRVFGLNEHEDKEVNINQIKQEKANKRNVHFLYINIELTDTYTGEVRQFDNIHQVAEFLNCSSTAIGTYIRQNSLIRKQYRIKAERNKNYKRGNGSMKLIRVFNVNTKEEKILEGAENAAKYIGVKKGSINWLIKNKRITKSGYKLEHVED